MADLLPHKLVCWNCESVMEFYDKGALDELTCQVTGEFVCNSCFLRAAMEAQGEDEPCIDCGHYHAD